MPQRAALLILEPIFEAACEDCSYGFRPGRSAHQALQEIHRPREAGFREVYDADLQGYFDSIPHEKRMACLRMRIADRSVLHWVRRWLEAVVMEADEAGKTPGHRPQQGTPQGGVRSPLLANGYRHGFDKALPQQGWPGSFREREAGAVGGRWCARQCLFEMRAGPSQPVCGVRLQTTLSGLG